METVNSPEVVVSLDIDNLQEDTANVLADEDILP